MPTLRRSHRLLVLVVFLWRIQEGTALISSSPAAGWRRVSSVTLPIRMTRYTAAGHLQKPRIGHAATTANHSDSGGGAKKHKMITTTTAGTTASSFSFLSLLAALGTIAVTILVGHPQMAMATTNNLLLGGGATFPHEFQNSCWEETSVFLCQSFLFEVSAASSLINTLIAIAYGIYLENKSRKERRKLLLELRKTKLESGINQLNTELDIDIGKLRLDVDRLLNKLEPEQDTFQLKAELESDLDNLRSDVDRFKRMLELNADQGELQSDLFDRLKIMEPRPNNYDDDKLKLERLESDILDKVRSDMDRLKTDLESDLERLKQVERAKPDNYDDDKLKLERLESDLDEVKSDMDRLKFSANLDRIRPTDNEKRNEKLKGDIIDVRSYVIAVEADVVRVKGDMIQLKRDVDTINEKMDELSKDIRQLTNETKRQELD